MVAEQQFLSTQDVADRLGVDMKTVRRYIKAGKITATRLGRDYRIPAEAISKLAEHEVPRTETCTIIAVVNQKGGAGKTTTTFNLGVALFRQGYRVLLVDLDPQASLSRWAGMDVDRMPVSIYNALLDPEEDVRPMVLKTKLGPDILPSSIDLAAAEVELINQVARELILKDVLEQVIEQYHYILIDCPPSLSLLTINALAAANQVLIPVQCEYLASRGIQLLQRTISGIRRRINRDLEIAGILPTMYDGRTLHAKEMLGELRSTFPGLVYSTPVKATVRMKEAPIDGSSVFDREPESEIAQAFDALAEEVTHGKH